MAFFTWKGKQYSVTMMVPSLILVAALIAWAVWSFLR